MDVKKVMELVKETFDDEVFANLDDFCGAPMATIVGKGEFFSKLEKRLKVLIKKEPHLYK
jgi:hypothetical protein